jgi:TPR repeat protein
MAELRGPECASDAFKVPASDFRTWRAIKVAFLRIFERRPEVVAARRAEARRAARSPASGSYCYRPEQNTMFELRGTACAADAFKVTASAFRTWSSGRDAFLLSWDRARGARDAGAQFRLAKRYERGDGVPQDMADALRFYRMASNQGSERALAALQRIMNESRLAEERSRAEEERKAAEAERRRVTEEQKRAVEEAERQRIAGLTRGLASADVVTAIVNDGVNLRALPESTASVVRQLPKGRQVQVTGVLPSGWLRIAEEGTAVGWIFKTAVAPGTLAASPPAAARPAVLAAAADEVELDPLDAPYRITSAANVRAAPDVSAQRVAGLREGDRVTALGKVRGKDWYLVERDGERLGFVFGPLLTPVATSPQTQVAAVAAETRRAEPPQPVLAPERRIALVIGNGR